jgi:8-oxo-dGTP diphosphatase
MNNEHDFYQVSLKMFLKNNKGEILVLEARLEGSFAGYYDFPGGRIDTDEFTTPLPEVVQREVIEEVGNVNFTLNTNPVAVGRHLLLAKTAKKDHDIHVLYLFYEAQYIEGEIKISDEHIGYKWVDFSKNEPAKLLKSGNLEGLEMYLAKRRNL